jgi:hypothetical protein
MQHITIFGIMTVQTPPVLFRMFQYNFFMHLQFPALQVGFLFRMTLGTGENIFAEGWGRYLDIFRTGGPVSRENKPNVQQNH